MARRDIRQDHHSHSNARRDQNHSALLLGEIWIDQGHRPDPKDQENTSKQEERVVVSSPWHDQGDENRGHAGGDDIGQQIDRASSG